LYLPSLRLLSASVMPPCVPFPNLTNPEDADLFAVDGGEVVARFTGGDTAGMRRAAELIINTVRGKYGVELSLHEADTLLIQKRPRLYTSDGEVSLLPLVKQALVLQPYMSF
jgi:hypothetical protein